MLQKLLAYLDDILVLTGCGLITFGAWQLSPVAAYFVAGAFCITGGLVIGRVRGGGQ